MFVSIGQRLDINKRTKRGLFAVIFLVLILLANASLQAQVVTSKNLNRYIDSLSMPIADTSKTRFALAISEYYQNPSEGGKANPDSASVYSVKASLFALQSGSPLFVARADLQKAKLLLKAKDYTKGIRLFEQSVQVFIHQNHWPEAAEAWWWVENSAQRHEPTFNFIRNVTEQSIRYFQKINNPVRRYLSLGTHADILFRQGLLDSAEAELEVVIKALEGEKYDYRHYYYNQLSFVTRCKGNYAKSLHFNLEAIRTLVMPRGSVYAKRYYLDVADLYYNFDQKEKYREYNIKAATTLVGTRPLTRLANQAVLLVFRDSNYRKAIDLTLFGLPNFIPVGAEADLYNTHLQLATLYEWNKQPDSSEFYFLKVMEHEKRLNRGFDMNAQFANYYIARFYCSVGKFDKASPYLSFLLSVPPGRSTIGAQREAHYMQYRVDSAKGNFQSALHHLRRYKELYDIMHNASKSWQLQEITVKYETEKKEHQLKLLSDSNRYQFARLRILQDSMLAVNRQRQIEDLQNSLELTRKTRDLRLLHAENLLSQAKVSLLTDSITNTNRLRLLKDAQRELVAQQKEQSIKLLTSEAELNKRRLADASLRQKLVIGGIVLLLLAFGLLGYFYRLKQKTNKRVQASNNTLQRLVEEKEWLLKEVHHRVKNNLHTA